MAFRPRTSPTRRRAVANGWRSGLEDKIGASLTDRGIEYEYESFRIPYVPEKEKHYTPDFILPNGIIIETKGHFVSADRSKHLLVQKQHPDLDIRFLFSRSSTRISKQSATTYAKWCEFKGFKYADLQIPEAWLKARPNKASLAAIERLKQLKKKGKA